MSEQPVVEKPASGGAAGPSTGKRAGARRGARPPRKFRPRLLALALAVTLAVVAWGYLVWAAIDFGATARGGDGRAWGFLALASVGAIACLFVALMLLARIGRDLGLVAPAEPKPAPATRVPGGRRAAR
ncbi:MAG TPA: hypothetical protein VGE38_13490 [Nocardioides sp.]|uniref:hypothetical protein n=1 Tax=Nocardioides sp. TaxID=35761 RepID=UPI002EDA8B3E